MSRLAKKPLVLPKNIKLSADKGLVKVEGPKGKLEKQLPEEIEIKVNGEEVSFIRPDDEKETRAKHGLVRAVVQNMVVGVSEGFTRNLVSIGVGYRMNVQGQKLNISAGFSHPVVFDLPQGIAANVQDQTKLSLTGADKELLGSVADKIRKIRPPEPYKGKGIRYESEKVIMKEGKSASGSK